MASIDTISDRSSGIAALGKAYFETSTNKFIVYNGSAWIEFDSDGTGAPYSNAYSANFNGGNYFLPSNYAASGSITAVSYSFWMNSSDTTSSMTLGLSDYGASAKSFRVISPSGTKAYYIILNDGTGNYLNSSAGGQDATISGSTNIRDGLWHHVVFTASGTSVKIYIDGGDAAINGSNSSNSEGAAISVTSTKSYAGGANSFVLARNGTHPSYYYNGLIDEVGVFEYELSSSEVRSIYNGGTPDDLSSYSPTAWWRMGDDSNDSPSNGSSIASVSDSSGNGNALTQATASGQPNFSTDVPA